MGTSIVDVTPGNVEIETLFCVKNIKDPGFDKKREWFNQRYEEGLCLKILKNDSNKSIGFIEFIPAEHAWRPVIAPNYIFIHCMFVYSNDDKHKGNGSRLIRECEEYARVNGYSGICVMTSEGTWITNKDIFIQNGYSEIQKRGRFELLAKKINANSPDPSLLDWTLRQKEYLGWNIVYADQCPWHEKSVKALQSVALEAGINLNIKKLKSAEEAKNAPSGFGVFSLLKDGVLLEDHYLSETRFRNILNKELKIRL